MAINARQHRCGILMKLQGRNTLTASTLLVIQPTISTNHTHSTIIIIDTNIPTVNTIDRYRYPGNLGIIVIPHQSSCRHRHRWVIIPLSPVN